VFGVLAVAALIVRVQFAGTLSASVQLLAVGLSVLALVSALSAVVFRLFETPREITMRDREGPGDR
jgi:membrane protein implicated in regulation of membrane protease activity